MHSATHSIMFHHFHSDHHPKGQGSISAQQFQRMIDWLGEKYNLLSAEEYQNRFLKNQLKKDDICLSFDDALLCQFDIAVPILNKNNLRAFFFVYSSPIEGTLNYLEIFRYFRTVAFSSIDEFYLQFFEKVQSIYGKEYFAEKKIFQHKDFLSAFPFYTYEDKWFRYLRDDFLGKNKYESLMLDIVSDHNFKMEEIKSKIIISDEISKHAKIIVKGNDHWCLCFFHNEKTPSMKINNEQSSYYCFGCGAKGDLISFYTDFLNYTFNDALKELANKANVYIDFEKNFEKNKNREIIYIINKNASDWFYSNLFLKENKNILNYLIKRNITKNSITDFQLGCTSNKKINLYNYLKERSFNDNDIFKTNLFKISEKKSLKEFFYNRLIFPILPVLTGLLS